MMLVSCALIIHIVPGFNNFEILDSVTLSENSVTYSLYLNYDKLLAALYLSLLLPSIPSIRHTIKDNPNKFYASLLMTFFTLSTVVFLLALKLSIIDFAPKIPTFWIEWILINLIITCFAEELLFRGFIQQKIKHALFQTQFQTHKFQAQSSVIAITISSLLFGLAHIPAGAAYAILACALSLFYGYAFNKTQNILLPVLLHFTFNLLHFLFFSYPYLAH
ncbi:CPBP family intramembrane glutamic endopeptidase [Catenovulum sediminis]|uniref:CPBP family intramembrane glutamic endopeptidase n=1 Tax=Catenovulum sediminis TaxID=1740262 RepID=A0ABV1RBX3_9ALTE